jgi:2-hydroxymuconate-semialdehyde hydrolase
VLPELQDLPGIAPDMVGFGYTERPAGIEYGMDVWAQCGRLARRAGIERPT